MKAWQSLLLLAWLPMSPLVADQALGDSLELLLLGPELALPGRKLLLQGALGRDRLRGLVEKTPNPEDRRRVRLKVTDKGHALLSELAPVQREVNDLLFQPLDADRFAFLNAVFGELVKSADEAVDLIDYMSGNGRSIAAAGTGT